MFTDNHRENSEAPSILGAGLLCLDIINRDGRTQYLNGGSCGNIISALSFLGWGASIITGRFGDSAGKIIDENLKMLGIDKIEVGNKLSETPRIIENVIYEKNEEGTHEFLLTCPQCGRKLPGIKPLEKKSAEVICQSTRRFNVFYSDRTSPGIKFLRTVEASKGSWTVYEPNSARNLESFFTNSIESHIVKFSSDRISFTLAEKLRIMEEKGKTVLIVRTDGKNGLDFCYRKRDTTLTKWIHLDAQPVAEFIDSSGAGDWGTAGILFNLVNKYPIHRHWLTREDVIAAVQYGQALSAISCSFVGAQGLIYAGYNETTKKIFCKEIRTNFNELKPAAYSELLSEHCPLCLLSN